MTLPTLRYRHGWQPAPVKPGQANPRRSTAGRWVAAAVLTAMVGWAVLAPWVVGFDPMTVDYRAASRPPGVGGWLGTDVAGRSMAVATGAGLRISLGVAAAASVAAVVLGAGAGLLAGFAGGRWDQLLMRLVDGVNTLPHLLLGLVLVSFFRGSLLAMVAAIALTHWTQVARIIRTLVLTMRSAGHIEAAVGLGYRRRDVLRWHLVPALLPQLGICVALMVPHAIWHEATLSFLGVGLPPTLPSLGVLLNTAQPALLTGDWWQLAVPAGALVIVTVATAGLLRNNTAVGED